MNNNDIQILRELAKRVAELAARPVEEEKEKKWTAHNDLKTSEPVIITYPQHGWAEILPESCLMCTDAAARRWEMELRRRIFQAEKIKDDSVTEKYIYIEYVVSDSGWGLPVYKEYLDGKGKEQGGIAFEHKETLIDYAEDFPKLRIPEFTVDRQATDRKFQFAGEIFDGILELKLRHYWWWSFGLTWDYCQFRNPGKFMMDFFDEPEYVHKTMQFFQDAYMAKLNFLEKNGLLTQNIGNIAVGSGGRGFTNDIAPKENNITMRDMWGFGESQETVGISPEMFAEFVLPYQIPLLERFALNCYGCCEPLDHRWKYIKRVPNLRRVVSSPWSNKKVMAEYLGKNYILSAKAHPSSIATHDPDWQAVRQDLKKMLADTKGCSTEIIMQDTSTFGKNPTNIIRWVEIAREEIANA
ncbi:MAG: hypothetical protein FWD53_01110 [Phycisphaerales bacterium]|nr:hypothetical protein [Phycisphaerales bacterium]